MMSKRRSIKVIVLAGLFCGVASLQVWSLLFGPISHWKNLLVPFIIYLSCGMIVFSQWSILLHWQKAALIGIAIQAMLLFAMVLPLSYMVDREAEHPIAWLLVIVPTILSPLEALYDALATSDRGSLRGGLFVWQMYWWEIGLLHSILRIAYAGTLGAIIGKLLRTKDVLRIFKRRWLWLVLLIGLAIASGVLYNVFPTARERRAWKALDRVHDAIIDYKSKTGHWPESIDELNDMTLTQFEGTRFGFDREKLTITLPVWCEKRGILHLLTGGRLGETTSDGDFGIELTNMER